MNMDLIEEKPSISALNSNSKVELKLFINKEEEKVLYAEASKEFVDFLFSFVSLPLGMVINLLQKKNSEMSKSSITDLCNSIQSLNKTYLLKSSENLTSILNPNPPRDHQLAFEDPLSPKKIKKGKVYMCMSCLGNNKKGIYISDDLKTVCPCCTGKMNSTAHFVPKDKRGANDQKGNSSGLGRFVKEMVTYMITDNLEVKPLSTISTLALLNSFDIRDLTSLQEMVVHVGAAEGLKLLEESLQSKDVLTNVFLAKRSKRKTLLTL